MNWLITGGCGFVGLSLIRFLQKEAGHRVRVLDNLTTGTKEGLADISEFTETKMENLAHFLELELVVGDVLCSDLALQVSCGADVIVHLAANTGVGPSVENPRADCMVNVIGTLNYLEACRINKVPKFIFASSGAPAGEVEPPIHEELPPHPVSPYGASKLAGEGYCSAYFRTFGVHTVMLRFGNVYGPGSMHKGSVVAKFIKQALNNEELEIYGDGAQTRDFIYIDDLVSALNLSVVTADIGGEAFQIASNRETTIAEITETIIEVLGTRGISNVKVINGSERKGDVRRNYSDTSKAKVRLGWSPKMSQRIGIERTVEYFLNGTV